MFIKSLVAFGLVAGIIIAATTGITRIIYNGPDPLRSGDRFAIILSVHNDYGSVPVRIGNNILITGYKSTSGTCTIIEEGITCDVNHDPTTVEIYAMAVDLPCGNPFLFAAVYEQELWIRTLSDDCVDIQYFPYLRESNGT